MLGIELRFSHLHEEHATEGTVMLDGKSMTVKVAIYWLFDYLLGWLVGWLVGGWFIKNKHQQSLTKEFLALCGHI